MTNIPSQFDTLAPLYENISEWPFRRDIETPCVLARLGDIRGLCVLDYGCGAGTYSRLLKQNGAAEVVGYDVAEGMVDYARQREQRERLGIQYLASLAPALQRHFDLVLSVYVLPYAASYEALRDMCQSMHNLLRPGGRLLTLPLHPDYATEPDYYRPYGFTLSAQQPYTDGAEVVLALYEGEQRSEVTAYYWSEATLRQAMQEAGFRSVQFHHPRPAAYPTSAQAPAALRAYLDRPHAVLMECVP